MTKIVQNDVEYQSAPKWLNDKNRLKLVEIVQNDVILRQNSAISPEINDLIIGICSALVL